VREQPDIEVRVLARVGSNRSYELIVTLRIVQMIFKLFASAQVRSDTKTDRGSGLDWHRSTDVPDGLPQCVS
jgi:hypothetical protein